MQRTIIPEFIESAPTELSDGVIYISDRFRTALHKCCCGCGREVVTPLNAAGWSYTRQGETITLKPSIGNWSFACKSHYLIISNEVVWSSTMSDSQIAQVKARDKRDKEAFINSRNKEKFPELPAPPQIQEAAPSSWVSWLSAAVRRWWS